jgi:hypothetical protein
MENPPQEQFTTYRIFLEHSLVLSLLFLLIFFQSFPKHLSARVMEFAQAPYRYTIEEVPVAHQVSPIAPWPQRQTVMPVEFTEPGVPEGATIDGINLQFTAAVKKTAVAMWPFFLYSFKPKKDKSLFELSRGEGAL